MKFIKPAHMKKLKYGSIAIGITVFVIAAIVIVNVIFSALAYKNNWYIDLTEDKLYELSDAGRELLDTIDPEKEIVVHFCAPFDTLEGNPYSKMAFELVKQIASSYDNITYDYIDTEKNPTAVAKYKSTTSSNIYEDSIIVESGTEFRLYSLRALFTFDSQEDTVPWAFNGERKIISAMVQCTQAEVPIAYVTSNHGETLSESMVELFYDAGYELKAIDLSKDDIEEDGRLIVISNPKFDFEGISEATAGRKSEIEKIDDFLDGFGNVMVFLDPDTNKLPELEAFLEEWGIAFDNSVIKDPTSSLDPSHYTLVGEYSLEDTIGGSFVSNMLKVGTPPNVIVRYARPINILWEAANGREVSTAIYTSKGAQKYVDGTLVEEGRFPLVTISRERRNVDNTAHNAYVFAIGSKYFTDDNYLKSSYGNSDIIYLMMRSMGKVQVPIDIDYKVFEETALNITISDAISWTVAISAVIPAIILCIGIVIWIRRKHV